MIVPARWLLLLLLGAATCAAQFARSSHFLNTVLGSKHTAQVKHCAVCRVCVCTLCVACIVYLICVSVACAQLGLSIDDMDAMLEEARAQSSDGLQRTYIACSTLTGSAEAGAWLCAWLHSL